MTDAIVGTAGIFMTLALIALCSFAVGLVIYCVGDFVRLRAGNASRGRRGNRRPVSPVVLADRVRASAQHVTVALLGQTREHESIELTDAPRARWNTAFEITALLLHVIHDASMEGLSGTQGHTMERTLFDVSVGNLFRLEGCPRDRSLHAMLRDRQDVYAAAHSGSQGTALELSPAVLQQCADRVADALEVSGEPSREVIGKRLATLLGQTVEFELARFFRRR